MWLQRDTPNIDLLEKKIGVCVQNTTTIISLMVNIAGLDMYEHMNLHLRMELDIHMSSKRGEESGYMSIWILKTILY